MTAAPSPSSNRGICHLPRGEPGAPPLHTRFKEEGCGEEEDLLLRP